MFISFKSVLNLAPEYVTLFRIISQFEKSWQPNKWFISKMCGTCCGNQWAYHMLVNCMVTTCLC